VSLSSEAVTWIVAAAVMLQTAVAVLFPGQGWPPGSPSATTLPESLKWSFLTSAFCIAWFAARNFAYDRVTMGDVVIHIPRGDLNNALPMRLLVFAGDLTIPFLGAWATGASLTALAITRAGTLVTAGHILAIAVTAPTLVVHISDMLAAQQSVPWVLVALGALNGLFHGNDEGSPEQQKLHIAARTSTRKAERPPMSESSSASNAQRRSLGRLLVVVGWASGALGLLLAFSGNFLHKVLFSEASGDVAETPVWIRLTLLVAVVAFGGLLLAAGRVALKRGRRHLHRSISSFEALDGQRYLLYLRPFSVDSAMASSPTDAPGWLTRSPFELPGLTQEAFVVRQFQDLGRIIAIGQPGERLPELGAERGYLPVDDWKDTLSSLIQGAHAIIMTASPGAGTVWEFTEAIRVSTPTRLLLLIYSEADYYVFRDAVKRENTDRSITGEDKLRLLLPLPHLPNIPPPEWHGDGARWNFPLTGILYFNIDRSSQFTRFPSTVPLLRHVGTIRRLVRRELKPVMDHVSQLPEPH
jgi:hypothetical protein